MEDFQFQTSSFICPVANRPVDVKFLCSCFIVESATGTVTVKTNRGTFTAFPGRVYQAAAVGLIQTIQSTANADTVTITYGQGLILFSPLSTGAPVALVSPLAKDAYSIAVSTKPYRNTNIVVAGQFTNMDTMAKASCILTFGTNNGAGFAAGSIQVATLRFTTIGGTADQYVPLPIWDFADQQWLPDGIVTAAKSQHQFAVQLGPLTNIGGIGSADLNPVFSVKQDCNFSDAPFTRFN